MKPFLYFSTAIALTISAAPAFATTEPTSQKADMTDKIVQPPVAEKRPHTATYHGETISDDYHWLRDQSYPVIDDTDILDHVKAENAYFEAQMGPQAALTETIFQEMKGRVKEDDSSVPQKDGDYVYWSTFETGGQYRKHYRKTAGRDEQSELGAIRPKGPTN